MTEGGAGIVAPACSEQGNALTTVVLVAFVVWIAAWFVDWAIVNATFVAKNGPECGKNQGACWALIREKYRYIFFGSFPYDEHWRPLFACIAMLAMLLLSCDRRMWNWRLLIWGIGSFVAMLLMFGELYFPLTIFFLLAAIASAIGWGMRGGVATRARS